MNGPLQEKAKSAHYNSLGFYIALILLTERDCSHKRFSSEGCLTMYSFPCEAMAPSLGVNEPKKLQSHRTRVKSEKIHGVISHSLI